MVAFMDYILKCIDEYKQIWGNFPFDIVSAQPPPLFWGVSLLALEDLWPKAVHGILFSLIEEPYDLLVY